MSTCRITPFGGEVTAVNGTQYSSATYYGQPITGQDAAEPFSFVNFFDTVGTFDTVVFDNSNTTGTGFESDNHTVFDASTPDPSFVYVANTKISLGDPVPSALTTPEPGALGLMIAMGLTCSGVDYIHVEMSSG